MAMSRRCLHFMGLLPNIECHGTQNDVCKVSSSSSSSQYAAVSSASSRQYTVVLQAVGSILMSLLLAVGSTHTYASRHDHSC